MKDASQYPVTYPYGATTAPYSPNNPHRGEDRACPKGTPVIVNGVQIGLVGSTGLATGPHLHVQKNQGSVNFPPNGQGFSFTNAKVIKAATDKWNGNHVVLEADGFQWYYLHLDKITCSVGQVLPSPQRWVRVVVPKLYVRSAPNTSAPLAGTKILTYGMVVRTTGTVTGQNVNGNDQWHKSVYGNYFWSGGTR
jgi:hypothetical protein